MPRSSARVSEQPRDLLPEAAGWLLEVGAGLLLAHPLGAPGAGLEACEVRKAVTKLAPGEITRVSAVNSIAPTRGTQILSSFKFLFCAFKLDKE